MKKTLYSIFLIISVLLLTACGKKGIKEDLLGIWMIEVNEVHFKESIIEKNKTLFYSLFKEVDGTLVAYYGDTQFKTYKEASEVPIQIIHSYFESLDSLEKTEAFEYEEVGVFKYQGNKGLFTKNTFKVSQSKEIEGIKITTIIVGRKLVE